MNEKISLQANQSGAVFVTGLVFLMALSLLGITAMKMATIEERMSGNMRDRMLAMQAGEMALRYAEHHIRDNDDTTNTPKSIEGITDVDTGCTDGLCYYGVNTEPTTPAWKTLCSPTCPISYTKDNVFKIDGVTYTAPELPKGLIRPPTYLIEGIQKTPAGGFLRYYYRVTVRAEGAKDGTVVWLQETFRP